MKMYKKINKVAFIEGNEAKRQLGIMKRSVANVIMNHSWHKIMGRDPLDEVVKIMGPLGDQFKKIKR